MFSSSKKTQVADFIDSNKLPKCDLLGVCMSNERCCQIFLKGQTCLMQNFEATKKWSEVRNIAPVQDCDYVREFITHCQEVKCSRGQKDQSDPAVV